MPLLSSAQIVKLLWFSPHSVLSSLETVPASQTVHSVAPDVLILFVSQLVQVVIVEFLYVPAVHKSEISIKINAYDRAISRMRKFKVTGINLNSSLQNSNFYLGLFIALSTSSNLLVQCHQIRTDVYLPNCFRYILFLAYYWHRKSAKAATAKS